MLVVVPVSKTDLSGAADLMRWIGRLGRCSSPCVIVADAGVDWLDCMGVLELARKAFSHAQIITNRQTVMGWIPGAHSLWREAAQFAKQRSEAWLWLEPDAIPLTPGWLQAIEKAYKPHDGKFMGHIYDPKLAMLPKMVMSGVAVYPPDAIDFLEQFTRDDNRAWDTTAGDVMVNNGVHTPLIHHLWGQKGLPPRFSNQPAVQRGILPLSSINKEAVIFHRNKDGSLMRLLALKYFGEPQKGQPTGAGFMVVFPFFNGDADMAIKNAEWISHFSKNNHFDALMVYEEGTRYGYVGQMAHALRSSFGSVSEFEYPCSPKKHWPEGANWAFQHVAVHIHQKYERPWFWLEYDAIPVNSDWLIKLQSAYASCGKPFMGPKVTFLNHMNGVGIYPADFPLRCPKAMKATGVGWDFAMRDEMKDDLFDARQQIQHVWGIVDGMIHPFKGDPPVFHTVNEVRKYLYPKTLVFHRCKDGSLIDRMREMRSYENPRLLQAD